MAKSIIGAEGAYVRRDPAPMKLSTPIVLLLNNWCKSGLIKV